MGASTGDLLVEHPEALDKIFEQAPTLIVTHCESSPLIAENQKRLLETKTELEIEDHPTVRDVEACFASSSYAVELAKKYHSQLHVLHITTEKELSLFEAGPIENKHITAEACVHHLWFSEQDYPWLGNRIKCNPAIKSVQDRDALLDAVKNDRIDIIATDHAPHTFEEKNQAYPKAPAGMPLVQHALSSLLEHTKQKRLTLTEVVQKSAHNPAIRYGIKERGFIREGYFADLVLADLDKPQTITDQNSLYKCAWTPFDGQTFSASIAATWVNGFMAFDGTNVTQQPNQAMSLQFQPSR
ncbi:dihydroorotase [Vibrio ishigakensis]|uniref:Dihydroorotase n=1 Tax=Vibrio ishigakensis TaxID=1481914 RepID=A0A0B8Q6U1_9VIBR|nr:dihydroorotase [Vibrio ishigakensis]